MKYVINGFVSKQKIEQELDKIEKRYQEDKQRLHDIHDELVEILEFPPSMPDYSGGQCFYKILENDKDFLFNMKQHILTLPHIGASKNQNLRSRIIHAKSALELIQAYIEEKA